MLNEEIRPENAFLEANDRFDLETFFDHIDYDRQGMEAEKVKAYLRGVLLGKNYNEISQTVGGTYNSITTDLNKHFRKGIKKVFYKDNPDTDVSWIRLPELLRKEGYGKSEEKTNSGEDESAIANPQPNEPKLQEDYIKPPQFEFCLTQISIPGCLLRIKAPIRIGKKTLIDNILNCAKNDYRTTTLSLRMAQDTDLENLDTFLRWFCTKIAVDLKLPYNVEDYWNSQIGNSKIKCMAYFEDHLLLGNKPLILAIYRLDRVYPNYEIAGEFFSLLQTWHEEAKNRDIWKKLRLIVTYRENYNKIQPHRSPFNKGREIVLSYFTKEQVKKLTLSCKNNIFTDEQIKRLMDIVGGHPDLVKLALNKVIDGTMEIENLLTNFNALDEIYGDHLSEYWRYFEIYPKRKEAFKKVVTADSPMNFKSVLATEIVESLRDLGLLKIEGENVEPSCNLYRWYFRDRL